MIPICEKLERYEALVADYADLLEKADDIGLNVLGNDLREVQATLPDAKEAIETLVERLDDFCRIVKSDDLLAMDPDLADAVAAANEALATAALSASVKV